ncbi:MAG: hypothetical protein ACTSRW_17095 [Candidatus Helarchaeota archaeon]
MKTTVSLYDFRDAFASHDRDNFSYEGLEALYNWIKDVNESCGTETELDVIGLCCEFTEYENLAEFQQDYNKEDYETIDDIRYATTVIMIDDERFIVQNF